MSRVLELYPPAILPFTGVTSVSVRAWQRHFTAYLEQDINSPHFLPDGLYETWQARGKNRARIAELHVDDPERFFLMDRLTAVLEGRQRWPNDPRMDQYNQAHLDRDLAALLQARNAQLSKFITLITVLCPALTLLFRNNEPLVEDEEMSPTLENMVVLLWLERIDPRLPKKVSATFAHQMVGNTSLRDLQPTICGRLPGLLQELDEAAVNSARPCTLLTHPDPVTLTAAAAFSVRGYR